MKKALKRLIALILAITMCLSLLSANVWATEESSAEDGTLSAQSSEEASGQEEAIVASSQSSEEVSTEGNSANEDTNLDEGASVENESNDSEEEIIQDAVPTAVTEDVAEAEPEDTGEAEVEGDDESYEEKNPLEKYPETSENDDIASGTIIGFNRISDSCITLSRHISLSKLMKKMPETITVKLKGEERSISIPVNWFSEIDYDTTHEQYYLFWAKWDNTKYPLDPKYNIEDYKPFIEVQIDDSSEMKTQSVSEGVKNIVERAHQQVNIAWTPVNTVRGYVNSKGTLTATYYAGTTYNGIPYGQQVNSGKYVPNNVSFDTFLNAVKDSGSVFYTSRGRNGSLNSTYYASDCSAFVSYSYGLPRMTTSTIASSSQFSKVSGNSIYNAQIGDCFNKSGSHVELVTGMHYNSSGTLVSVEISEQTPPKARTVTYTPVQVQNIINTGYTLLRYNGRDGVGTPQSYNGYNSNDDPVPDLDTYDDIGDGFIANIIKSDTWSTVVNKDTNVEIGEGVGNANEHWWFDRQEDGSYTVRSMEDGKYLDVSQAGSEDGLNIHVYDYTGEDNQRWYIKNGGNGRMLIPKCATSSCMDIENNSSSYGANARLWKQNNTSAQEFNIYHQDHIPNYSNIGSGYIANIIKSDTWSTLVNKNKNLEIGRGLGHANEHWWFERQRDGTYTIRSMEDGKYLDVFESGTQNGLNIYLYDFTGADNQRWYIVSGAEGRMLVPKCATSSCVDIDNNSSAVGTNARLWEQNNTSAQIFNIYRQDQIPKYKNIGNRFLAKIIKKDTQNEIVNNNENAEIGGNDGNLNEYWQFVRQSDGSYTIQSLDDSKYLDVSEAGSRNGLNIHVYDLTGEDNQKWYIVQGNGGIFLVPKCAVASCLDIENNSSSVGANAQLWERNGSGAQVLSIIEQSSISIKNSSISLSYSFTSYDGKEKMPEVTVQFGNKLLNKDTDYLVSYTDNINLGTATVTVTGTGIYTGSKDAHFSIIQSDPEKVSISACSITFSEATITYDGTAKEPVVNVKYRDETLVKGTDYQVSYKNNVNAGTGTVTVTGKGNYTGSKDVTFSITGKSVDNCTVTLSPTSFTCDGTAKEPSVTVKDGNKTLNKGTDYQVSYKDNVSDGTATVTVTGKGNYTGSKGVTFSITGKSIDNCTVMLSPTSFTYDGTAKEPSVTVKDGNKTLNKGTDYQVSYKDNVSVGTATVTVTGKGNYTGSKDVTFAIVAPEPENVHISTCTITLLQTSFTYDGTAKQPTVTVKDGDKTLTKGTDYSVVFKNNVNVGAATVTVTGKGNYTGSKDMTFSITGKSVTNCTVTLSSTSFAFDGTAKEPAVTVRDGNKTLTKGTDFEVSYKDNVDVGTAFATVTGKGNYTGSINQTFAITGKNVANCTITLSSTSFTFDRTAKEPAVTVKDGNKMLSKGSDYEVSYKDNVSVGTAVATVTGKGNYTGSASRTFAIASKSVTNCTVTLFSTSFVYDGTAKTPPVTVKDGDKTLIENTDYEVSYKDNINVGTATATVIGKGNYADSKDVVFSIVQPESAQVQISSCTIALSETSFSYDGKAKRPAVTVKDGNKTLTIGSDYEVIYKDNVNVGTAFATVNGKGKYTGSASQTFVITGRSVNNFTVTLSPTSFTYDGTAKEPTVTIKDGAETLTKDTDYEVTYRNNVNVGTAFVTVTAKGNYTGSTSQTFSITGRSVANCMVTLSSSRFIYDGTTKKPTVIAKDGSKALVEGTDFEVSYSNNINVGTASVTISGQGNYTGRKAITFEIISSETEPEPQPTPEKQNNTITAKNVTKTYLPKDQSFKLGAYAKGGAKLSYKSNNKKKVTVDKNGKVTIKARFSGTVKITIIAAATNEYNVATKTITVTVPTVTNVTKATAGKGQMTVQWKKNATGKGYEIQYSTDKRFKKGVKIAKIRKNATLKAIIKKLKKGTWYVRIRTVNGKAYSDWSKAKSLKVAK